MKPLLAALLFVFSTSAMAQPPPLLAEMATRPGL